MTREELTDNIKFAMIDTGRVNENWRVKVTGIERVNPNSDYVRVYVNAYKPRSRKPDYLWDICIDAVRELIFWEQSTFENVK